MIRVDIQGGASEYFNSSKDTNVHKSYYYNKLFSDVTGFFYFAAKHFVALIGSREHDPVEISKIVTTDPSSLPPISSIADRYTRSMVECMVGYPLYNPRPFSELSMEYPRSGVNIGDVGFVRGDGVFDFLFNICPSQNGLINPPNLPDGFSLEAPYHSPTRNLEPLPRNTCLFPKTITKTLSGEYICEGSDGAVLVLPEGAAQYETINRKPFEDLAKRRGVDWYKYAMDRGRSIPNGSLYLVTSFTKCTPWGIAVFDRPCDPGQGLTFGSSPLSWNGFGALTTKVANTNEGETPNQCVFLRGYKIKLCKDIFDNLYNDEPGGSDSTMPSLSPQAGSSRMTRRLTQCIRGGGVADLWSRICTVGKPSTRTTKSNVKIPDGVTLHADFNSSPFHPSDVINAALLSQNPDAKVALTHDDVWCELLRDNFPTLNYMTLVGIAQSYTSIIDENGCVSLQKTSGSSNVVHERSHPVRGTEIPGLQESKTGIKRPSFRIEGTPPREGSFLRQAKKKLQIFFSIRSSHSNVASKDSQRGKSHENTANPNIGDKNQSVGVKVTDRQMRSVDRASEEAEVGTDDTSANLPTVDLTKDKIDWQDPRGAIQASEKTGEGVFRKQFPHLDEAKGSDDRAEKLGGGGSGGGGRR